MKTTSVSCAWCQAHSIKPLKEVARQLRKGRTTFFCDTKCAAFHHNSKRTDLVRELHKICPTCNESFITETGKLETTFCSRRCASLGSVTDARREAGRLVGSLYHARDATHVAELILKKRESFKYKFISEHLISLKVCHEFEKPIGNYVFDLVIEDSRLAIEFDGPDHSTKTQLDVDKAKSEVASSFGYTVVRIPVTPNEEVPVYKIAKYIV